MGMMGGALLSYPKIATDFSGDLALAEPTNEERLVELKTLNDCLSEAVAEAVTRSASVAYRDEYGETMGSGDHLSGGEQQAFLDAFNEEDHNRSQEIISSISNIQSVTVISDTEIANLEEKIDDRYNGLVDDYGKDFVDSFIDPQ